MLTSETPDILADWYRTAMNVELERHGGEWLLRGAGRNLLIAKGPKNGVRYFAYSLTDGQHVNALKAHIENQGTEIVSFETALFEGEAFSITDLDGNVFVFGTSDDPGRSDGGLPARLQHIVFTTTQFQKQTDFYTNVIGFRKSDVVLDSDREPTACFMRPMASIIAWVCSAPRPSGWTISVLRAVAGTISAIGAIIFRSSVFPLCGAPDATVPETICLSSWKIPMETK